MYRRRGKKKNIYIYSFYFIFNDKIAVSGKILFNIDIWNKIFTILTKKFSENIQRVDIFISAGRYFNNSLYSHRFKPE